MTANLPRLAAAPAQSLVVAHGVITFIKGAYPRVLTVSDESGSITVTVPSGAAGGMAVNENTDLLIGSRVTVVGLRTDDLNVRASNIDVHSPHRTADDLDALLAAASAGAPQPVVSLLALPAGR
ncbi:hypothetical protein [Kitasatospora griseola]|uniref:hypothetical protein n=1 Tax=Kitasatospora griseola TaxID=2064 RepID=UPI003815814D